MATTAHPIVKAIKDIKLKDVPQFILPRHAPRKEQAVAARALFKQLGLKGIRVRTPNYSMASTVDIYLPETEFTPGEIAEWNEAFLRREHTVTTRGKVLRQEREAQQKLSEILDRAFPNHHDRSDVQTDYFDRCWSIR